MANAHGDYAMVVMAAHRNYEQAMLKPSMSTSWP
jgi:hypothetical protein